MIKNSSSYLNPVQRRIALRLYRRGKSYREIGKRLGLSTGVVYRGLKPLRDAGIFKSRLSSQAWLGRHHTKEAKRKVSEANKGRQFTKNHRRKLREARKGKRPFEGKHHTGETKRKLSEALKHFWQIKKRETDG